MDLFILLCVLLIKTVTMEILKEDTGNIAETLKLLTIRFDRMALDFHSLESRLETKIQKMHDEFKSTVTSWQTSSEETVCKKEILENIKSVIDVSVHKQAAIVYRTLAVEKLQMVKFRREVQSDIANFKGSTDDSMQTLKEHLEDTSLKLDEKVRTGTEECIEKVNNDLSELGADIQDHNKTLEAQERKIAELAAANANKITSISSTISRNTNSITSLSNRISSNANGIAEVLSMASSNANSISSHSSRISSNSDRISSIVSDRAASSSFTARLTKKLPNYSQNKRIVFDYVVTNRGYDYSSSTGVYTAPVSGYYIFLFNVQCNKNKEAHVELTKNGAFTGVSAVAHSYDGAPNITSGNAGILYLSKGDKVCIETSILESTYDIWPWRTTFSGALLY